MKKLLSGILAITMSINAGLLNLNTCNAVDDYYGYELFIDDNKNDNNKETKLIVSDGCVYKFNKAKNEIKVEKQDSNLLWYLTKKFVYGCLFCLVVKFIPCADNFFNNSANFIKKSCNFVKEKLENLEDISFGQMKKLFVGTEFYKYVWGTDSSKNDTNQDKKSEDSLKDNVKKS